MNFGFLVFVVAAIPISLGLAYLLVNVTWPRFLVKLGQINAWWSPVRVLPPEGEFYIITKNTPTGPFDRVLESIQEMVYDPEQDRFRAPTQAEIERDKSDYLTQLGLARVERNKDFLVRPFRYMKYEQDTELGENGEPKWKLVEKIRGVWENGNPPSYYRRYDLAIFIDKAEIKDNPQIDAVLDLTVEIESVQRAFFFEGGWITKFTASVQSAFREYVSDKTFEEVKEVKTSGAKTLVESIKALSGESRDDENGLRKICGIIISNVQFVKFGMVGSAEMLAANEAVAIADRMAIADKRRGEGTRDRLIEEAKGDKEKVAALASQGPAAAMAKAIIEAQPNAIGGDIMSTIAVEERKKEKDKEK